MTSSKRIVAFAGSNSTTSINKRLATHAAQVLQDDFDTAVDIHVLDLNDYDLPLYSPTREADGIPQQAHDFYNTLGSADGIIVSFAEHNGNFSAAFKNIFDWASRIDAKVFHEKPVLVMATSPGGRGGQSVLAIALNSLPHLGAKITSNFSFGPFNDHFDTEAAALKTPELALELRKAVATFEAAL